MKATSLRLLLPVTLACTLCAATAAKQDPPANKKAAPANTPNPAITVRVVITLVQPESPAAKAGITNKVDLIKVNGIAVTNAAHAGLLLQTNSASLEVFNGQANHNWTLEKTTDSKFGLIFSDQLPRDVLPFGYVVEWTDGIVLDIFSMKFKQAGKVLNPYTMEVVEARSLKSVNGVRSGVDGIEYIPVGDKYIYQDSEGRKFKVMNEKISAATFEKLTTLPQWKLLQLQPYFLTHSVNAQRPGNDDNAKAEVTGSGMPEGVIYRQDGKGFRIRPPTDSRCYLAMQKVYVVDYQNKFNFRNDTGLNNIDYNKPIYTLLSYDPKLLKEDTTNNVEKALFYFHRCQADSNVKEFNDAFLSSSIIVLQAQKIIDGMAGADKTKSVKMYKTLETGDTLEAVKTKLQSEKDVTHVSEKGNTLSFHTQYLSEPADVAVMFGKSGTVLRISIKVALGNPLGNILEEESVSSQ